jgi:hypothetical protein
LALFQRGKSIRWFCNKCCRYWHTARS